MGWPIRPLAERIEEKLVSCDRGYKTPCLIWTGYVEKDGYGRITEKRKSHYVHKALYEIKIGPVPEGLQLDHHCEQRDCANLSHLEPVTGKVNTCRGRRANSEKTHCLRGHPFDTKNTYWDRYGNRSCKTCRRNARKRPKKQYEIRPSRRLSLKEIDS